MIGGHFIKGWSRTQNHVTMSSAEAELVALVKCSAELLGVRSMLRDLGVETSGVIYADSSAAVAIAKRKGAGKLRHINVSSLWVQERQDRKDLDYRKVLGTDNPADMMTKHLLREPLDKCMGQLNQWRRSGRAKTALDIQGKGKGDAAQEEANTIQVIEDDWRDRALAHRVLDREWHGETHFEVSTGEWKSYIHYGWRHALMTPKRVRALDLEEGTQWTGRRRTLVRAFKQ